MIISSHLKLQELLFFSILGIGLGIAHPAFVHGLGLTDL